MSVAAGAGRALNAHTCIEDERGVTSNLTEALHYSESKHRTESLIRRSLPCTEAMWLEVFYALHI